ncbi:hypothetical protein N7451_012160 [Penicillium sp. IBT 35674x]|nr:hypothetical protein N7451_012160 [Penicillium sp. IBT 35674x]
MWEAEGVQEAVAQSRRVPFHDDLIYFYNSIGRISAREWLPNNQDILQTRLKTTGISETLFNLGSMNLLMVDVGGQRSERKKWIQCFEDVNCLIFVAALSGYDQCLVEDHGSRKLSLSPFSHYHTDFPGSDKDFYAAAEYLNRRFLDMDSARDREIFTHYTTATDTNLLRKL